VRVSNTHFDGYLLVSPADIIIGPIAGMEGSENMDSAGKGSGRYYPGVVLVTGMEEIMESILFFVAGSRRT
jgi:hypothetical protein